MKYLKPTILVSLANFILIFGGVWLANGQESANTPLSPLDVVQETPASQNPVSSVANTPQQPKPANSSTIAGSGDAKTDPVPTPGAVQPPPPVADNRCIVTIQGNKYDVTQFRAQHPGGDIFQCGTDMTGVFFSQHDQNLLNTKMAKYRIN